MWGLCSNVCKGPYCVWKKVLCTMAVTVLAMAVIINVSHLQPSVMTACCFYCQVHIPVWPATWVTTAAQGRLSGQPGGEIPNSWCLSVPFALLRQNDLQLYCWDRSPLGCTKALVGEPLLSFLLRLSSGCPVLLPPAGRVFWVLVVDWTLTS